MSKAQAMKSMNWNSTTGRIPTYAAPIAAPTKPSSASGVSRTRSGPNFSRNPSVTRNAPPYLPMSSPMRKTDLSASISSQRPREIAWRNVSSGIALPPGSKLNDRIVFEDPFEGHRPVRQRRLLRIVDRVVDRFLELLLDGCPLLIRQFQLLLEARDRILLLPLFEELGGHVGGVVVHRVAAHAKRLELDQLRTPAGPRLFHADPRDPVDLQHVVAVPDVAGNAERLRLIGEVLEQRLLRGRRRIRVLVVLDDDD